MALKAVMYKWGGFYWRGAAKQHYHYFSPHRVSWSSTCLRHHILQRLPLWMVSKSLLERCWALGKVQMCVSQRMCALVRWHLEMHRHPECSSQRGLFKKSSSYNSCKATIWERVYSKEASCSTRTVSKKDATLLPGISFKGCLIPRIRMPYLGSGVGATWICCSSGRGRQKQ